MKYTELELLRKYLKCANDKLPHYSRLLPSNCSRLNITDSQLALEGVIKNLTNHDQLADDASDIITNCLRDLATRNLPAESRVVFITHCLTTQIDAMCCRFEQLGLQFDVAAASITAPPTTGPTSIQEGKPNILY